MFRQFSIVLAGASGLLLSTLPTAAADYSGCDSCGGGGDYVVDYSGKASDSAVYDPDSQYFLSDVDQSAADPNQNFVLRGSLGVASISADERVFAFTNGQQNLSLLQWRSTAPIVSLDAKSRFGDAWTLRGHIDAAIGGSSNMTDYDWQAHDYTFDNWTDRSISPNTTLNWYLSGDLAIGRDLPISDMLRINVNGGLKYTDIMWTAVGGTYLYSTGGGFRNTPGTLPNVPGIDYRMRLPVPFLGIDADVKDGAWTLDTTTRAGLTAYAYDIDNHYLRSLKFLDQLSWSQDYSFNAKLGYDFGDHFGAFLEGSYERMFAVHGDTDVYDTTGVQAPQHESKAGGADLTVWSIKAGLKGQF